MSEPGRPFACWWMATATEATLHFHYCPIGFVTSIPAADGHLQAHVRIVTGHGYVTGPAASVAQGMRFVERFYGAHGLPLSTRQLKRGRPPTAWLASLFAERHRSAHARRR